MIYESFMAGELTKDFRSFLVKNITLKHAENRILAISPLELKKKVEALHKFEQLLKEKEKAKVINKKNVINIVPLLETKKKGKKNEQI